MRNFDIIDIIPKERYELAIFKWESIIDLLIKKEHSIDDIIHIVCSNEKLKRFEFGCSYCNLYYDAKNNCDGCPIVIHDNEENIACYDQGHPYDEFRISNEDEDDYEMALISAKELLNLIKENKPQDI